MSLTPNRRFLIVEDDNRSRDPIRGILQQMGYEVVTAASVREGLAALDPLPQCILLDLVLPDGPGEVILERIRAQNLPCRVIISSSDHDRGRLEAVHDMRPAAVLLKPVGLSELIAACYAPAS